ncbi:hypothetical protein JTE90_016248 [Oedothorax gibbosus]|uniref:Uncharacterized protein n=1 Tax=Oedothorax gibbosus TaxID=931172 RepID=A0AAV6VTM8_9ARAC|nr:hypothetical protein JTE90_016248 [Oedothorax gibbosus]
MINSRLVEISGPRSRRLKPHLLVFGPGIATCGPLNEWSRLRYSGHPLGSLGGATTRARLPLIKGTPTDHANGRALYPLLVRLSQVDSTPFTHRTFLPILIFLLLSSIQPYPVAS